MHHRAPIRHRIIEHDKGGRLRLLRRIERRARRGRGQAGRIGIVMRIASRSSPPDLKKIAANFLRNGGSFLKNGKK